MGNAISGFQNLENNTKVYLYFETEQFPERTESDSSYIKLYFGNKAGTIRARYGISFISTDQAKRNLEREIQTYNVDVVAEEGRKIWNEALGKIEIEDQDENNKTVFYTSLYRVYERPVNISEDGKYFSATDGKIHEDDGHGYFTDDWIWDTYRAAHPLRIILNPGMENSIIRSYIEMAKQMPELWMPTFPEITGDSRRMNCNHAVATVADAMLKGLRDYDLETAYQACKQAIDQKTLAPWSSKPAGWLDSFYKENGYIPALWPGEPETVPEVQSWEKRQAVEVTLGTSYDEWCLSQIARELGKTDDYNFRLRNSYNYRNIFNPESHFFHPKDKEGNFINPVNYDFPGEMGARPYFGENNGWNYRWDVQHNIADLIKLMGGNDAFCLSLDEMFQAPLGRSKYEFYAKIPDQTGNVGQFSMANEPSLHIPYLYNYAGESWKTQKRIRLLLRQWFRNDLMGLPGDEDGGGMSAFVVFSAMGFYPVTPGLPVYSIGSPLFSDIKIKLDNGKIFEIEAKGCSEDNKYIQSAILNGKPLSESWFLHDDIIKGGKLELQMGDVPNYNWGNQAYPSRLSADELK